MARHAAICVEVYRTMNVLGDFSSEVWIVAVCITTSTSVGGVQYHGTSTGHVKSHTSIAYRNSSTQHFTTILSSYSTGSTRTTAEVESWNAKCTTRRTLVL